MTVRPEPLTGSLRIPARHDGVRFVWTGDIAGQGNGINPDFLCSGDTVYADGPVPTACRGEHVDGESVHDRAGS